MTDSSPTYRERFARLRQKQETSFTPIFFHRPAAILLLLPLVEIAAVTPNRLTTVSILMRFAAAGLLWPEAWGGPSESTALLWSAAALWNLGGILDAADGALARYRGTSSAFGRFYDKVSDRLITLVFMVVLSARAMIETGDVRYVFVAFVYVALMSASSVAKWVELGIVAEQARAKGTDPAERPAEARSAKDWALYLLWSLRTILVITEMDLPLWGSIAVLLDLEHWLFVYLGIFSVPYTLGAIGVRAVRLYRMDAAAADQE